MHSVNYSISKAAKMARRTCSGAKMNLQHTITHCINRLITSIPHTKDEHGPDQRRALHPAGHLSNSCRIFGLFSCKVNNPFGVFILTH